MNNPYGTVRLYGEALEPLDGEGLRWQDAALCAEVDPDLHFPEKGGSALPAKRICRACGVRAECLQYALERNEAFGVWGGYSEEERHGLRRQPGTIAELIAAADAAQDARRKAGAESSKAKRREALVANLAAAQARQPAATDFTLRDEPAGDPSSPRKAA